MKIETKQSTLITLIVALLITASVVASKPPAAVQGLAAITSGEVVTLNNGAVVSDMIPDGRNTVFTNTFGVPVLITDVQVLCESGACNNVAILPPLLPGNPPDRFHVRFDRVTAEPEFRSFTTGILWNPGDPLDYFKTGGGLLHINLIGIKLSS